MSATFQLNWSRAPGVMVDSFNVYSRPVGDDVVQFHGGTPSEGMEVTIPSSGPREFFIAPVVSGIEANEEDWATVCLDSRSTADLEAVPAITDFAVGQDGAQVVAGWTAPDYPHLDHYEIREGATWEAGLPVATAGPAASAARWGWWAFGDRNYHIKAFATSGLCSAVASAVKLTINADPYLLSQAANDEHGGGFAGTKTATEVSGGNLQLEDHLGATTAYTSATTTYTYPIWGQHRQSGTYVTAATDVGAVVNEKVEIDIDLSFSKTTPTADQPMPGVYPIFDASANVNDADALSAVFRHVAADLTVVTGFGLKVEIDTAQDGVPTWDGYRVWVPGAMYRYRQVRLRFTLSTSWPFANPQITKLTWTRFLRNLKDEQTVTNNTTGGFAVNFDAPFTGAPKVTASVIASSALHATIGTITSSSCLVYVWDAAGVAQSSGTVHVHSLGV